MSTIPAHDCIGSRCHLCRANGDEILAGLNVFIEKIEPQLSHLKKMVDARCKDPTKREIIDSLYATIKDAVQTKMIQKDYYLGLNIAIEAEMRKPENEQNFTVFIGFCMNMRNLIVEIEESRLFHMARADAIHKSAFPDGNKKLDEEWAAKEPNVKRRMDLARKKYGD
jgi:hypothetical protein